MTTLAQAKDALRPFGMSITKRDDEYRVNYINGAEATAYYTNDIEDAVRTGRTMAVMCEGSPMPPRSNVVAEVNLYLVNFATNDDWECAVDDGVRRLWETCAEMAEPTGVVTTDLDAAAQAFKQTTESFYRQEDNGENEPVPDMHWLKVSDTTWHLMFLGGVGGVMQIQHVGTVLQFNPKEK